MRKHTQLSAVHRKPNDSLILFRGETPLMRATLIPSEPPYRVANFTISQLITFLRDSPGLTDPSAMINLLEAYQSSCPNLMLKLPLSNDAPSVEIKVTPEIGQSVVLYFDWTLVMEFLFLSPWVADNAI